jgi:hypothetical protein
LTSFWRIVGVSPYAEPEDDLTLLPGGQIEAHLDRGAGIQAAPTLPERRVRIIAAGFSQRTVASQEFSPIAGYGASRIVHVEERSPVGNSVL